MDQDSPTPTTPTPTPSPSGETRRHRPWYRRRWFLLGAPLAIFSLLSLKAFAHGFGHRGFGRGFGPGATEQELIEHAKDFVAMAGRRLSLTADQQRRLEALAVERVPALVKHREELHDLRAKMLEAAARNDQRALEDLRKQGVALADRASQQWLAAYGKLSEILTPAQRAQVLEHLQRRGHGGGRHGRRAHGNGHGGFAGQGAVPPTQR